MTQNQINKNIGPWQVLSSTLKYENPWITVTDHKVLTPAGEDGQYGVVKFKNKAVGIVPYDQGQIWLVGQTRFPLERYSWEIPEGGCPIDEDLQDCARRELQEETGLIAASFTHLLEMHLSNSVTDEWGIVYLAQGLTQAESNPEPTEDITLRRLSLEEFYQEVERGDITDALTVAACYKLMLMKERGQL